MRLGSRVKRPAFSRACSALVYLIFMVALVVFVFKHLLVFVSFFLRMVFVFKHLLVLVAFFLRAVL